MTAKKAQAWKPTEATVTVRNPNTGIVEIVSAEEAASYETAEEPTEE